MVDRERGGPAGAAFARYRHHQQAWMGNAAERQAWGEVMGSGAVEQAVDLAANRRGTGRGMRWTQRGRRQSWPCGPTPSMPPDARPGSFWCSEPGG